MTKKRVYKGDKAHPLYTGGQDDNSKDDPNLQPKVGDHLDAGEKRQIGEPFDTDEKRDEHLFRPYFPSEGLICAVNLAIKLNRPLLLEGEPGCGKTCLADSIAYEFSKKYCKSGEFWPYHIWNVKSYGRARDGLYTFDTILRLRDAQIMGSGFEQLQKLDQKESDAVIRRLKDKNKYLELGPLGKALLTSPEYRSILLIDEIDKADSDFPNDLLSELDRNGFSIPETGAPFKTAQQPPIILITSNRERPLPEPFLRRCLYFYVDYPDDRLVEKIIERRFGSRLKGKSTLLEQAIEKLHEIRTVLKGRPGTKQPGTSELLEFLEILLDIPESEALSSIDEVAKQSPYLGILLKTKNDQEIYRKSVGG